MDIQPTRPSPIGMDPKATEAAQPTRTSDAAPTEQSAPVLADADRIELSDAARTRSGEAQDPQDPALEQARQVLRDWPSLDPERKAMILARLEEGFYSKPESIKQMAEGLYADLTEQPLEAQGADPQA
ncbi:MAG: hypothetical protein HKN04_12540 [Rhodothermaceae bacterium]|nr:hypothetical protein [Rhodothermaceae bacterium]